MNIPLVIYHGHCLDGFGSAYAAYVHFVLNLKGEADFHSALHGERFPEVSGRLVYIVDFSYKRDVMKQLCQQADQVIILDHHISAMEDLAGLDSECDNLTMHWDNDRSGAMITWEYFHTEPAPRLIHCIQDRDLWRWEHSESQALNTGLMSKPFTFEFWHSVATNHNIFDQVVTEGETINRYRDQLIQQHKKIAVLGDVAGYRVPIVNCPRAIVSELLGELAEGFPFAAGYVDRGNKRTWSLRSTETGLDVAQIATRFGGGGHVRAAGFSVELPELYLHLPD